jgi:hypothetical protein
MNNGNYQILQGFTGESEHKLIEITSKVKHKVLICDSHDTKFKIHGKINQLQLSRLEGCTVEIVDNVVGKTDMIFCKKTKESGSTRIIFKAKCPIISLTKCDEVVLALNREFLADPTRIANYQIVSEASANVNVVFPGESEDPDPVEITLPEQFQTVINKDGSHESNATFLEK